MSKADFAADFPSSSDDSEFATDIDRLYEQFLNAIERVQAEHKQLLTRLIDRFGIGAVYVEGLTEDNLPVVESLVEDVRKVSRDIDNIRNRLEQVSELRHDAETNGLDAAVKQSQDIEQSLTALLQQHRFDCLRLGATGMLYAEGKLHRLLRVEGTAEYAAADPVKKGTVEFDEAAIGARHNAQIRRMSKRAKRGGHCARWQPRSCCEYPTARSDCGLLPHHQRGVSRRCR